MKDEQIPGKVWECRIPREALEVLLARRWGSKLKPVRDKPGKGKKPPRRIDRNTVVFPGAI